MDTKEEKKEKEERKNYCCAFCYEHLQQLNCIVSPSIRMNCHGEELDPKFDAIINWTKLDNCLNQVEDYYKNENIQDHALIVLKTMKTEYYPALCHICHKLPNDERCDYCRLYHYINIDFINCFDCSCETCLEFRRIYTLDKFINNKDLESEANKNPKVGINNDGPDVIECPDCGHREICFNCIYNSLLSQRKFSFIHYNIEKRKREQEEEVDRLQKKSKFTDLLKEKIKEDNMPWVSTKDENERSDAIWKFAKALSDSDKKKEDESIDIKNSKLYTSWGCGTCNKELLKK